MFRKSILYFSVFCFSFAGFFLKGQELSKKEIKKLKYKADDFFDKGEYLKSMELYEQLLKTDSLNVHYNYYAGVSKFNLKRYRFKAVKNLLLAHNKISYDVHYYLGNIYHLKGDLDMALKEFNTYLSVKGEKSFDDKETGRLIDKCLEAKKKIENPTRAEVVNLGAQINSPYPDYVPLISADGKSLYFTSRRPGSTGNKTDAYGDYFEDIYESTLTGTSWSTPKNLGEPVNSDNHDACSGLTAEGHTLLIYRAGKTFLTGDIYSCDFDGTKWSQPVALDKEVDSDKWQEPSACYSPDGNTLYFSSNRPGGFGGKDIYCVEKLPNGKWGKTLNMGPSINTAYDEDAPFMHPDGKRLFFSSTGHENMGGYDVFYSVVDSNMSWSKPVNMGYPINTVDDDIYFVVTGNGNTGYISSDREGGLGETDIYKVNLHENDLVYDVHTGFVRSESGAPLEASVTLIETKTHKVAGVFKSNSLSGKFVLLMAPDRDYTVLCESEGYISESVHMMNKELDFEIKLKKK